MNNKYDDLRKHLAKEFKNVFNDEPTNFFLSPGRFEVIGNHTDHNHGLALVASAAIYNKAAARVNGKNRVVLNSKGFGKIVNVEIKKYDVNPSVFSTTYSLIAGVITGFINRNYKVEGVDIYCESDILSGSGISSSAAFEMLICTIFNKMFNDNKIDKMTMVHISQEAEKEYFGKPCGLLDQIGCAYGGLSLVDFNDPVNPQVTNINFPFDSLSIILTNPGGSHSGLDDYYASIPNDMFAVAKACGKSFLRDVNIISFNNYASSGNHSLTDLQIQRAKHFYNECRRVEEAYKAIQNNNQEMFTKMINESGLSSSFTLKNTSVPDRYDNSPERALRIAREVAPLSGHRVHGGGFMGTIISFTREEDKNKLIKEMQKVFGEASTIETSISPFGSTDI